MNIEMKKITIISLTGLLFFTACQNTGSSTVGTYDKEETSQSSEKSESESKSGEVKEKTESTTTDTLKTSTNSGAENKAGETVVADSSSNK